MGLLALCRLGIKWGLGFDFALAQARILRASVSCRVFCSRNRFEVNEHGFFLF